MSSPFKGHESRVVVMFSFGVGASPGQKNRDVFESIKHVNELKRNIVVERIQKVSGHDALWLEMTQSDNDGNVVERSIAVTILLDDFRVDI